MKVRLLAVFAIICLFATIASAQTGFAGKWTTAPSAAAAAAPAPDGGAGAGGGGRGGRGGGQETRLDLKVEGTKLTGTIFEGGAELVVNEGAIAGKQAKFKTQRTNNGVTLDVNWTADMTDDNTISLSREFPNGIPAGFLGGGGGGRGGRGGGGGGGGGAAPGAAAGGAAPAAPAAPAAGGAPAPAAGGPPAGGGAPAAAGGPPAGGGGGAGRGGRGGGGGAPAAVVLHRAP